jgi:hypothetical protein
MAIVLILPALVLLSIGVVALFGLDKPPVQPEMASVSSMHTEQKYELAA